MLIFLRVSADIARLLPFVLFALRRPIFCNAAMAVVRRSRSASRSAMMLWVFKGGSSRREILAGQDGS
jgi:hypothetical protein